MSELVLETYQVLNGSKVRIQTALDDLQNLMSEHEENEELKAGEDWKTSEQTLAEAAAFVETI